MRRFRFWCYKDDYFPEILPIIWHTPLHGIRKLMDFWMSDFAREFPEQILSIRELIYPSIAMRDKVDTVFKFVTYPMIFCILRFWTPLHLILCLLLTHLIGSLLMALFNSLMFAVFSVTHISLFGKFDSWGKDFLKSTVREGAESTKEFLLDMPAEYFHSNRGFFAGLPSDIAKDTYRGLMKKFHPDVLGGDERAAQVILEEYRKYCGYLDTDGSLFDMEFSN